jgi:PAS domain S-box-containing protein
VTRPAPAVAEPSLTATLEGSLATARAGWELALDSGRMGYWEWDVASGRSRWSARSFELFGLAPTADYTVEHADLRARVHPEDSPKLTELLRHVLRTGEPFTYEYRIVRPDGAVRSIAGRGRRVDHPATGAVRLLGVGWDVTADREHGNALETFSERARVTLNLLNGAERAAQVGAFLDRSTEPDGASLLWSDTTYRIFGWPREQPLVRGTVLTFFWPGHAALVRQRIAELRAGGDSFEIELPLIPAPGRAHWVRLYLRSHRDAAGRCVEISGAVQDISVRKQLESDVAAASGNERQRIATELHDDLGQALTVLGLQLCALRADHAAGRVHDVAARLDRLDDLLAATHVSCRQLSQAYAANVTRTSLVPMLQRLTENAGPALVVPATLAITPPSWLPDDSAQELFRIAQEAVTNAVKHAGARRIEVSLAGTDDAFELLVRDDGSGFVPAEARAGVGLTSMHHRAARIAGILRIDSAPGAGTCVRVLLARAGVASDD